VRRRTEGGAGYVRPALTLLFFLCLATVGSGGGADYFAPRHRVSGIGVDRANISSELLDVRTDRMIESQTFTILRDSQAVPGAKRITGSAKLQSLFRAAGAHSGFPTSLIEAIAYLESWGEPKAESPSGPRGIMQISAATARTMGLKVVLATRYRITREKVAVNTASGAPRYKTVTRRTPYVVTVRDDRLSPDRAIPAAAVYLAGLEQKFGGRDWAIFAYHCGVGCVGEMQDLTRHARGIPKDQVNVPRMFFSCSPAWNRELYEAIGQQMQRDYSPTYYFRVRRAEQLLALYRGSPHEFAALSATFKSDFIAAGRAPHRLSVWLRRDDLIFHNGDDIRADVGRRLARALDHPSRFGYAVELTPDVPADLEPLSQASPAALGTLAYIAFETHRLHDAIDHRGETFVPLAVRSLVEGQDSPRLGINSDSLAHASGQVFDIDHSALPPGELECLRFVLDDLGWDGYLGFIDESRDNLHIGCAPSTREFFATVFAEAVESTGVR
jgi:hypothetical protein